MSPANAYCSGTGKRISRIRFVARTVSSRRHIRGRAMGLVNGIESSLTVRNVELSQSLMPASSSRGRLIWFQESLGQLCVWSKQHLVESYVFSAMIGAFAGLTSASARVHRKRASRSRFVKEAASWLRRLVESQSGRGSRGAPARCIRARSRALRSIAPEAGLECSSSDEHVMSLAPRESRADFLEVWLQLLDPSEWKLAAYRGFFREETF